MKFKFLLVAAAAAALAGCGGSNDAGGPMDGSRPATTNSQPSVDRPGGSGCSQGGERRRRQQALLGGRADARSRSTTAGSRCPSLTSAGAKLSPDGDQLAVGESRGRPPSSSSTSRRMRALGKRVDVGSASYPRRLPLGEARPRCSRPLGGTPGKVAAMNPETQERSCRWRTWRRRPSTPRRPGKSWPPLVAPTGRIGPRGWWPSTAASLREGRARRRPRRLGGSKGTDDSN